MCCGYTHAMEHQRRQAIQSGQFGRQSILIHIPNEITCSLYVSLYLYNIYDICWIPTYFEYNIYIYSQVQFKRELPTAYFLSVPILFGLS